MDKLLTKAEVIEISGFSYPQIWRWMREGKFPRSLKVGKGPAGRVMWRESEIEDWIDNLPTQRLKGDPPANSKRRTRKCLQSNLKYDHGSE